MKLAGVDVGGTFTDVIVVDTDSKAVKIHKVPSTPDDASEGLIDGLRSAGDDSMGVEFLAHGTTIATNSLLQYDGAQVGMITTRGYRDVLHIARHQRPLHYSIQMEVPWQDRALIKRRHRKVVTERLGPKGEVVTPLEEEEVATAARELKVAGVSSIVIGFLNSYRNPEHAARYPATLLLSGPAAGVLAGAHIGNACGRDRLITFDMGGTSADIGIVTPRGISEATARDTWIAGYPVLIPMIDVHTVGAGGGSVAYIDPGGAFRVGPRSAGARPGPASYGLGGTEPTVTDANLVLGRLRADHFLGGAMQVKRDLAAH